MYQIQIESAYEKLNIKVFLGIAMCDVWQLKKACLNGSLSIFQKKPQETLI